MTTQEEIQYKTDELLSLFEVLVLKYKSFYKKYSIKSKIEYWSKNNKFGVLIEHDTINIVSDKGNVAQLEFNAESWGNSTIQLDHYEFEANNSDDTFFMWLAYDIAYGGSDVCVVYNSKNKTIQFEEDVLEFRSGFVYDFKTKADKEEILFKVSLENKDCISYDNLCNTINYITQFKKRTFPKKSCVTIWSYKFPSNIKSLLEDL